MMSLQSRIANLSPVQRRLLAQLLEEQGASGLTVASEQPSSQSNQHHHNNHRRDYDSFDRQQLVAYIVAGNDRVDIKKLRQHAEQNLPEHMRPTVYVEIDCLPRLVNGKLDYHALPDPRSFRGESKRSNQAGADVSEHDVADSAEFNTLVGILAELIGMEDIRHHDNFFEIGGDSITAIQLVSRAREVGIQLSVASITSTPDIGSLAAAVQSPVVRQSIVSAYGPAPLTPIQSWFFSHRHPQPNRWNLGGVMTFNQRVYADLLVQAILSTIKSHPAMSTRFKHDNGNWSAVFQEGDPPAHLVQIVEQQSGVSDNDILLGLQSRFSLDLGWLAGFTIVVEPESASSVEAPRQGRAIRLFWVMHHLICDGLSVQLVLDSIRSGYKRLEHNEHLSGPAAQLSSYREWALAMQKFRYEQTGQHAHSEVITEPVEQGRTSGGLQEKACISVSKPMVGTMIAELATANEAYGTTTHELVLTALAYAWSTVSGAANTTMDIETHGRDALDTDFDTSGVVGWFTSYFPFTSDISRLTEVGSRIKTIKESYRDQHQQGRHYLLTRYGEQPVPTEIDYLPAGSVNVLFNFINYSTTSGGGADAQFWQADTVSADVFRSPLNHRSHVLELNTIASPEKITFNFRFSPDRIPQTQVEKLYQVIQEELSAIIKHCNAADTAGYTPADFPDLGMGQDDLDDFLNDIGIN